MACAVALAVLLAGCVVSARRGVIGDDIPASEVARTIDTQVAPALRTIPGLAVGHAVCPEHIDVSNGKTVYCTLPAGGTTLRVAVTSGKQFGAYFVHQADGLLDTHTVERSERASLANRYDLHADVHCGPPRFRALQPGARLSCRLAGRNLPTDHLDFKLMDTAGHLFTFRPHGMRSSTMDAVLPYIGLHKHGRRTIVPGAVLARHLHTTIQTQADSDPHGRTAIGAATCADEVDLSGARRAVCRMIVLGKSLRYEAWIDESSGLNVRGLDFALDTKRVAAGAVTTYREKLSAAGIPQMVAVDCGADRVVIATVAHGVPCKLTYGATTRPLTAYPDPSNGTLRFYVPPM
jgi:hypothetical protein